MTQLTPELVRELATTRFPGSPVVTCYLDVDGRAHPSHADIEHTAERALRRARSRAADPSDVGRDLDRIGDYIKAGFDRSRTRGLAIFSCASADLWHVVELPVPVRTQVVVSDSPHVRQLEAVLETNERFAVLLADRQRIRLFVFALGQLVERDEVVEEIPRDVDDDRAYEPGQRAAQLDAHTHRHLKHAAAVAFRACQELGVDHLILGTSADLGSELEACLHPYAKARVAGRINVSISADETHIVEAALRVEAEVERRQKADMVARLKDQAAANGRGVLGLDAVLQALNDRRVDTLVVSRGFEQNGWRCDGCGALALVGPSCRVCGAEMSRVDDLVEEAEEVALGTGSQVAVCQSSADLDVGGRIGAFLRY